MKTQKTFYPSWMVVLLSFVGLTIIHSYLFRTISRFEGTWHTISLFIFVIAVISTIVIAVGWLNSFKVTLDSHYLEGPSPLKTEMDGGWPQVIKVERTSIEGWADVSPSTLIKKAYSGRVFAIKATTGTVILRERILGKRTTKKIIDLIKRVNPK